MRASSTDPRDAVVYVAAVAALAVLLAGGTGPAAASAGQMGAGDHADLIRFLRDHIGLSEQDLAAVEAGQPVARLLPRSRPDEVAVFGIVRTAGSPESFVEQFRNIERFESGSGVRAIGRFSSPPNEDDMTGLRLPLDEIQSMRGCRPGDCALKLETEAIEGLRALDWSTAEARTRATDILVDSIVEVVRRYAAEGDEGLPRYADRQPPTDVGAATRVLYAQSPYLYEVVPALTRVLERFPHETGSAEHFIYWSHVEFGLKPVVRASHVVIQRVDRGRLAYAIASKLLYATHYFNSGLELRFIVDDPRPAGRGIYFLNLNRSLADGLTGVRGVFIGRTIRQRTREAMERYLRAVARRMANTAGTKTSAGGPGLARQRRLRSDRSESVAFGVGPRPLPVAASAVFTPLSESRARSRRARLP